MSYPLILAFGFASQLLLSGMALAGIPLLIHLLHRRHFVEARWAAMRFLLQASQKQSRRSRIEQLLLLLIRTLAIVLFVLALARPLTQTATGTAIGQTATHRILVLDATYSMQYRDPDVTQADNSRPQDDPLTRFDRVKQQALDLVKTAQPGDVWNLVRVARRDPRIIVSPATGSTELIQTEIQALKVSDSGGDLLDVLPNVLELTQQIPDIPEKEIVIYTDMQSSFLRPNAPERDQKMRILLEQIGKTARINIVNAALGNSPNIAVTEFKSERPYGLIDRPSHFTATIRNTGTSALKNQIVDLLVDDRLVETKRIDIPSDASTTIDWTCSITTPGEHVIETHVEDDPLPIDNRRRCSMLIRDELRVIIVEAHEDPTQRLSTTSFYVSRALAPDQNSKSAPPLIRPTILSVGELANTNLNAVDVVILCGAWQFNEREIRQLESFVKTGHGLILFPDSSTSSDIFNSSLHRSGAGPAPAMITGLSKNTQPDNPWKFSTTASSHSLIREFQRNPGTGLESTLVFQHTTVTPHTEAIIPLKLTTGAPAILERRYGLGTVIMMTTNPENEWSTWGVLAQSFVPILHESVLFSAMTQSGTNIEVGQVLSQRLMPNRSHEPILVRLPNGTTAAPQILGDVGQEQLLFDDTAFVGTYRIESDLRSLARTTFCANPEPAEGLLISTDSATLTTHPNNSVNPASSQPALLTAAALSGSPVLIRTLLAIALLALFVEPFLAFPRKR